MPSPAAPAPSSPAAAFGRAEAEVFLATLRRQEQAVLMARLGAPDERKGIAEMRVSAAAIARLRATLEHLRQFHDAVWQSLPWRLLERMRRLVGRGWARCETIRPGDAVADLDASTLRRAVNELAAFQAALAGSSSWRLTQRLRRLVGREW